MIRAVVNFVQKLIAKTPFSQELTTELDDYRESINQHDEELRELYAMVDKLKENLEEHKLMLGTTSVFDTRLNLSYDEKRILLVLYANDCLLSAKDIAIKLSTDSLFVDNQLEHLTLKGVPIIKQKSLHNELFFSLDPRFKAIQAKENVLKVTSAFSQRMLHNL